MGKVHEKFTIMCLWEKIHHENAKNLRLEEHEEKACAAMPSHCSSIFRHCQTGPYCQAHPTLEDVPLCATIYDGRCYLGHSLLFRDRDDAGIKPAVFNGLQQLLHTDFRAYESHLWTTTSIGIAVMAVTDAKTEIRWKSGPASWQAMPCHCTSRQELKTERPCKA